MSFTKAEGARLQEGQLKLKADEPTLRNRFINLQDPSLFCETSCILFNPKGHKDSRVN